MKFSKPALTVEGQLDLLIQRGLIISDRERALRYLKFIGYYRFSGYMRPLQSRTGGEHEFKSDVRFEDALNLYIFDRKLRLLVLDAVERIEVAIRAQITSIMSSEYGSHWYLKPVAFSDGFDHDEFIEKIKEQIKHDEDVSGRRDVFIDHYFEKYTDPELPPGWMIFEVLSMGAVSKVFGSLLRKDKKVIADAFSLTHPAFKSWAHTLSALRNICAHHGRVWNREFGVRPTRYGHLKVCGAPPGRFYAQAIVIKTMLNAMLTDSHWSRRLKELLDEHPEVDPRAMGFPDDWENDEFWGLDKPPKTITKLFRAVANRLLGKNKGLAVSS
jgi:abortive infection bacteriophage resistance protein